jgi:hypothetical protein
VRDFAGHAAQDFSQDVIQELAVQVKQLLQKTEERRLDISSVTTGQAEAVRTYEGSI